MIIRTFDNFLLFLEKDSKMYEYGCVMLYLTIPKRNEIISQISQKDLYQSENDRYGVEIEPHVTILYGISPYVDDIEVKSLFENIKKTDFDLLFTEIDCFFNIDYDVLKINVISTKLNELNELLKDNLDHTTQYKEYIPHVTIGYLKKGTGGKYLDKNFTIKDFSVDKIVYSKSNGDVLNITII